MTLAGGWTIAGAGPLLGVTRLVVAALLICHGLEKLLLGTMGGLPPGAAAAIVWLAGLIEVGGGALIARGGARPSPRQDGARLRSPHGAIVASSLPTRRTAR
jgi:uncharacterized membrane protein YphA (DoxX/SURF4 family)